jgi:hypothetical protein
MCQGVKIGGTGMTLIRKKEREERNGDDGDPADFFKHHYRPFSSAFANRRPCFISRNAQADTTDIRRGSFPGSGLITKEKI